MLMTHNNIEKPISSGYDNTEKVGKYNVRDSFKDIFGIYLLEKQSFDGDYDMPVVGNFDDVSSIDYLALYSDLQDYSKTENTCVCFYQYDHVFDGIHGLFNSIVYQDEERLNKYRVRFKNVKYIIGPDYSLFGDFPNALQIFNVYKSRICICWLIANTNAIVIPNVRWTFDFSFDYCLDGIKEGSNIAISTLGQLKDEDNREMFLYGLKNVIDTIKPKAIITYGFITEGNFETIFGYAKSKGIKIIIPHSKIDRYKKGDALYGTR